MGPAWLVSIAGVLALAAGWEGTKRVWASRAARLWGIGVAVAALSTLLWNFIVKPVSASRWNMIDVGTWGAAWESLQDTFNRFKEFVGWFGWLDHAADRRDGGDLLVALAAITVVAFVYGKRRLWSLGILTTAGTAFAPVVFEAYGTHDLGYFWQSRYTLPIAVGVPVLFGLALAAHDRPESNRRVVGTAVVGIGASLPYTKWSRSATHCVATQSASGRRIGWLHPRPDLEATLPCVVPDGRSGCHCRGPLLLARRCRFGREGRTSPPRASETRRSPCADRAARSTGESGT